MSVAVQAAVHYSENLRPTRNQSMRSLKQLFQVTGKLITDQTEITNIPVIEWQQQIWLRTTLLPDKAVQFATAKNQNLFRFSAVSGRHQSRSRQSMEGHGYNWFMESRHFRELDRIDGLPMEFEWNIFHRIHHIGDPRRDSKDDD